MTPKLDMYRGDSIDMSLATAAAELRYERAACAIELSAKEEEVRKLRLRNCLLGDEIVDLNEKLFEEAERGDEAEFEAQTWAINAEEASEKLERTMSDLRFRMREMENLRMELFSYHNISAESTKLLTEKLALSRELSTLRPETEHLRSQAALSQAVLTEKLSLQRQLSTIQAELENEKRTVQRIMTERGRNGEQNAQYEVQLEELRRDLAVMQKEREKLARVSEKVSEEQLDELKKELMKEKREREKAKKVATTAYEAQLDELRKELAKEIREHEKSAGNESHERVEELRADLAREKRERQKAERDAAKVDAESKTQKAVLDDKLEQFRTKLRSTKEKLKETEAELLKAQAAVVTRPSAAEAKYNNPRKRAAARMDSDATIGTPGDAGPAKRSKRASSVAIGEKSTFSITPFLNRATSVAPPSPRYPQEQTHDDEIADEEPIQSIENAASPTAKRAKAAPSAKKGESALAPMSGNKQNAKAVPTGRKKAAAALTLEKVTEEWEAGENENAEDEVPAVVVSASVKQSKATAPGTTLKPKSLTSFASFRDTSMPPQQQKKRKLLGGAGKTLFDEEEEGDGALAGARGGFGGQRAFGAFGGMGFGGINLLGGAKKKMGVVMAEDGFAFSPLKKDRKAMAAAAAAIR